MKTALFAGLLVAATLGGGAAAQAPEQRTIEPGYWETVNRVSWPIPYRKVERRCIRPAEVAKFLLGPSNHIYSCTYPTRKIGDGSILLEGSCKTKHGKPVPLRGSGAYTAETLHLDVRIVPEFGGLDIPVHASTDARRLGDDCPAAGGA